MFVPYHALPSSARIWIYTSSTPLTPQEQAYISTELQAFCESWTAHQEPLQASFVLIEGHFVVLAVNEEVCKVSGCSIDKSVGIMRKIGEKLQKDFFNRLQVGVQLPTGVQVLNIEQLKTAIANGTVEASTPCFNVAAMTKQELLNPYRPLAETWVKKYLKMLTA
jgi:hypothetical protein